MRLKFISVPTKTASPERDIDIERDIERDEQVWVEPPYRVIIHNDHVTTFEFVERLMQTLFAKSSEEAEVIAWATHIYGKCVVVVCPQSEAESLARKGMFAARLEGYPLKFSTEPD